MLERVGKKSTPSIWRLAGVDLFESGLIFRLTTGEI